MAEKVLLKAAKTMLIQTSRALVWRLQTQTLAALVKHPDYRLYWLGALGSNLGTWIQMVAQGWLVYDLTGSAFYLGAVGFANAVPALIFSPLGGVLADRFERRYLMVATQTAAMLLAFLLAAITLAGNTSVWPILIICFFNGIQNAINQPIRQTLLVDLVPREDAMNAIAVNAMQFHGSRTIGPALAGGILAIFGPGWCFFINAVSYLAVIAVLLAIKAPTPLPGRKSASVWTNLTEGLGYIRSERVIFSLLILAAVPSVFGMPYSAMMPAFASSVLNVGATGLGFLMSATGLGSVMGALAVASLGRSIPRGKLMLGAVVGFGLSLTVFATSNAFSLSLMMLVVIGATSLAYNILNQTFLQTLADEEMRGRVMSILMLSSFGLQPFGQMGVGTIAALLGPSTAVLLGGSICAIFALIISVLHPYIRRLT